MTTAFVMKASVAIFVLALGVLLLWANNVHDSDLKKGDKDEMSSSKR